MNKLVDLLYQFLAPIIIVVVIKNRITSSKNSLKSNGEGHGS